VTTAVHQVTLATRKARALKLRVEGYPLHEIAKDPEVNAAMSTVQGWIASEMDKVNSENQDRIKHLQFVQAARLDAAIRAIWPRVEQGDVQAVAQVVKIEERRAKLFGLDEPQRISVGWDLTNATESELKGVAARLGLALILPVPVPIPLPGQEPKEVVDALPLPDSSGEEAHG
jgi:hypothetical protein